MPIPTIDPGPLQRGHAGSRSHSSINISQPALQYQYRQNGKHGCLAWALLAPPAHPPCRRRAQGETLFARNLDREGSLFHPIPRLFQPGNATNLLRLLMQRQFIRCIPLVAPDSLIPGIPLTGLAWGQVESPDVSQRRLERHLEEWGKACWTSVCLIYLLRPTVRIPHFNKLTIIVSSVVLCDMNHMCDPGPASTITTSGILAGYIINCNILPKL